MSHIGQVSFLEHKTYKMPSIHIYVYTIDMQDAFFFPANISKVLLIKKYEVLGKTRKGITEGVTFELSLKRDDINHATIQNSSF